MNTNWTDGRLRRSLRRCRKQLRRRGGEQGRAEREHRELVQMLEDQRESAGPRGAA